MAAQMQKCFVICDLSVLDEIFHQKNVLLKERLPRCRLSLSSLGGKFRGLPLRNWQQALWPLGLNSEQFTANRIKFFWERKQWLAQPSWPRRSTVH